MSLAQGLRLAESIVPTPRRQGPDLSGIEVLVVDDHEDTADLHAAILEEAGAIAYRATSLLDALTYVAQRAVSLLVSDIAMPGGTGVDLIRLVRQRNNGVPAIAVTANLLPSTSELLFLSGFDAVIYKPVEPSLLVEVAANLCRAGDPGS